MRRMFSEKQIKRMVEESPQEVVKALKGQDINVEGVTSKGIANTGNIANIGDIGTTGKITGGEIVENMSGYSFEKPADTDEEFNFAYVGAVKNGNKITFVISGIFTKASGSDNNKSVGKMIIPQVIYDKLVSNSLNSVDNKSILFMNSATSGFSKFIRCYKLNNKLDISLYATNSDFVVGTPYEFRYEATFLLSENLISE